MEVCKKCKDGNFYGKVITKNNPFPNQHELSYTRYVVRCKNNHLIGSFEKAVNLKTIKTHHTEALNNK